MIAMKEPDTVYLHSACVRAEYWATLYNYLLNKLLSVQTEPDSGKSFTNILENSHEFC